MRKLKSLRYLIAALALSIVAGDIDYAGQPLGFGFFNPISEAQARVGRPATPISGAGVARRTTRRAIRYGAVVVALPAGCVYGTYYGYKLYSCGGAYYQPSGSGFMIVYF